MSTRKGREGDKDRDRDGEPASAAERVRSLAKEERLLLEVRDELYGGSWDELEADLRARLAGKPYIFQLATRIEEDLSRVERLREFEEENGVDLGALLRDGEGADGGVGMDYRRI